MLRDMRGARGVGCDFGFTLGALLAAVGLPALAAQSAVATTPAEVVASGGHSRQIDGVEVVFLRGSEEERSRARGRLEGPLVTALFRSFALAPELGLSAWKWNLGVLPIVRKRIAADEALKARYGAYLEGMREAHGPESLEVPELGRALTVEDMVAVSALPDLTGFACSSFAAWGSEIQGAGPVVGRNLDYFGSKAMLGMTGLVVHAPLGDRAGWVSVGWPGVDGLLTGFSDRGVSVAIHDVYGRAADRKAKVATRLSALRELIERLEPGAKTAERALAILRESRFGYGGNVMVAWRGGKDYAPGAVVFELHPVGTTGSAESEVVLRSAEGGDQWIACTNHFRISEHVETCERYGKLSAVLDAEADAIDFAGAASLIGQPAVRDTLYQTLCDLQTGQLKVRLRRTPGEEEWTEAEFDLDRLFREAASGAPRLSEQAGKR